jgi:putative oxidoreductase
MKAHEIPQSHQAPDVYEVWFINLKARSRVMETNKLWQWLFNPPSDAPTATILLRLMAGSVFLWEGILKFVYTNQGVGRFTKLGFPFPQATSTFDGALEIVGGILLITGLLTRLIAVPFIIEMVVAMLSTKIPLYLGTSPLPLPPVPPQIGFWAVLHEIRSEYAQLLTTLFLLIAGPGKWSIDALLARRRKEGRHTIPDALTA